MESVNSTAGAEPSQNSEEEIIEWAKLLFDHIEGQIRLADTKAQVTLAADALLASAIAFLSNHLNMNFFDNDIPIINRLAIIPAFISLFFFFVSTYYALLVARPTLRLPNQLQTMFYFGHIVQLSEQDFIEKFSKQSSHEIKVSVLAQVHTKSQHANYKFTKIRKSLSFLIYALLVWIIWIVIQLVLALYYPQHHGSPVSSNMPELFMV